VGQVEAELAHPFHGEPPALQTGPEGVGQDGKIKSHAEEQDLGEDAVASGFPQQQVPHPQEDGVGLMEGRAARRRSGFLLEGG